MQLKVHHGGQCSVQAVVPAVVKPLPHGVYRGGRDRGGSCQSSERRSGADPAWLRPRHEHAGGHHRADARKLTQLGSDAATAASSALRLSTSSASALGASPCDVDSGRGVGAHPDDCRRPRRPDKEVARRPSPLTWQLRHSARSSVYAMGLFSHEEFPDEGVAGGASGGAVERARGADVDQFGSDQPVVVGPGSPPEDGSCGQFAVQFHVSTSMLFGLTRIAGMRGVSVPEVCRQVIGVFVAQQEGDLGALLAAEAEAADYRPSLGDA